MMALNGRYKKLPKPVLKLPLTSSQSPLERSKIYLVPSKFKKGDLVYLNKFGQIMIVETDGGAIGIIMSNAKNCYLKAYPEEHMYWVYDVFVGDELVTDVPQDFMREIKNYDNERNTD